MKKLFKLGLMALMGVCGLFATVRAAVTTAPTLKVWTISEDLVKGVEMQQDCKLTVYNANTVRIDYLFQGEGISFSAGEENHMDGVTALVYLKGTKSGSDLTIGYEDNRPRTQIWQNFPAFLALLDQADEYTFGIKLVKSVNFTVIDGVTTGRTDCGIVGADAVTEADFAFEAFECKLAFADYTTPLADAALNMTYEDGSELPADNKVTKKIGETLQFKYNIANLPYIDITNNGENNTTRLAADTTIHFSVTKQGETTPKFDYYDARINTSTWLITAGTGAQELGIGTYTVACELVVKDGDGANTYKKVTVPDGFNKSIELTVEAAATEPVMPTINVTGVTVDLNNPDNLTQIDFDPAADKVINFTLDGAVGTTCGTDYVVVLSCVNNADDKEVFADTTLACDATSFTFAANTLAANSAYTVGMNLYTVKNGKAGERMDVPGVMFILKNGTSSTETIGFKVTGVSTVEGVDYLDATNATPTFNFELINPGSVVFGAAEGNAAINIKIVSINLDTTVKGASYTVPSTVKLYTGSYNVVCELYKIVNNPAIGTEGEEGYIPAHLSADPWGANNKIVKSFVLTIPAGNDRPMPVKPTDVTAAWVANAEGDTGILVEWKTADNTQGYEINFDGAGLTRPHYEVMIMAEVATTDAQTGKTSYLCPLPEDGMDADTYTVTIRGAYLYRDANNAISYEAYTLKREGKDDTLIMYASEWATAAATVVVPELNPAPEAEAILAVASNLGYNLYKAPRMKEVTAANAGDDPTYIVEQVPAIEFYWSATKTPNTAATAEQLADAQFELVILKNGATKGDTIYLRGNHWMVYVDEAGLENGTYTWKVRGVILKSTTDADNVTTVTVDSANAYVAATGDFATFTIPFTVAEEEFELRWYTGDVPDGMNDSKPYEAATEIDITDGYENLFFAVELAAKNSIGEPSQPLPGPGDYPADPDDETLGGEGQTVVVNGRMAREGEEDPDPTYGGVGEDPGFTLAVEGYNVVARVREKDATTYLDTVTLTAFGNEDNAVVFAYDNEAFYGTKVAELEAGEYEIEFMLTKNGLIVEKADHTPAVTLKHNFKLTETEESNEIEIVETTHGKDQLRFDTAKFSMLVYGLEEETYGEDYAVQVTITASNVEGFETIDTVILTEAALNPFKLALKDGEYHFYAVVVEKDNNKWVEKQDADNGPYFIGFDFRMGLPAVDEDQIKAFVGGDDVTFNWKGEEGFWYEFVVTTGGEDIRFFVLADEETESENGGYAYTIENNAAGTYTWKMRCVQLTVSDAEIALGVIMDQDNSINPVRTSGWANGNAFALPASVVTVLSESDADLFSVTELTSDFTPVTVKANYAADEFDGLTYSDAEPVIGVKVSNALFAGDYTAGTPNISYKMFVEKGTLAKQDLTTLSYAAPLLTEDEFIAAMVKDFEGFTEPGLWTVFFSLKNLNTLDGALSTLGELDEEDVEAADRDYVLSFVFYDAEGNELPVLNNPAVFEFSVGEFVEPAEKAAAPENFRISKIEIIPANEEEETAEEATITFKWDNKVYVTGAIWYGETKVRDIKPYAEKQASYNIDEEYNYSQYKGKELTYKVRGCKYENYALVEGSESEEEIVGTFILKDSVNPNEPVVEEPVFAITINGETSAYDEDWMSFMLTASGNAEPTIHYTATGFGEDLNGYKITYNVILNGGGEGGIEMKEAEEEEDFFYVEGEITNLSENGSFQLSQAMPEGEYRITISLEDEFGPVQNMETWDEYTVYVTYTSDGTGATPAPEYDITVYYGETELYEYYDLYGGVRPTFGFEISNFDKVPAGAKVGMAIEDDDEIYYKYTSVPAAAEGTISAVEDLTSDVYFYYVWITVVEEDETTANPLIDGIIFWYTVTPGSGTLVKAPELKGVNVYPNPAKGQFNVSVPEKANVAIYNANGQVVAREANVSGVRNYNLTTSGVYFVRVIANGQATVKRVVIR